MFKCSFVKIIEIAKIQKCKQKKMYDYLNMQIIASYANLSALKIQRFYYITASIIGIETMISMTIQKE